MESAGAVHSLDDSLAAFQLNSSPLDKVSQGILAASFDESGHANIWLAFGAFRC